MTVRVGLAGLGFMGSMHFTGYRGVDNADVVAVCDVEADRLTPDWCGPGGNIDRGQGLGIGGIDTFTDYSQMLAQAEIDMVDLCTPTFTHASLAVQALQAGKHVFCEKPMALDSGQCRRMVDAADRTGKLLAIGHVLRFWPEYLAMKDMIAKSAYGKLKVGRFFRHGGVPSWSWHNWMLDSKRGGLAAWDMHVHDTDTVQWLFGTPGTVCTHAHLEEEGGANYIFTQFLYDDGMTIVSEGSWLPGDVPFSMGAMLTFEHATVRFSTAESPTLMVYPSDGEPTAPEVAHADGYVEELKYFVNCVETGAKPDRCPPEASARSIAILEAEFLSARSGKLVKVK